MPRDCDSQSESTRRQYIKYGSAIVGGSVLAGCTSDGGSGSTPSADGSTETPVQTDTETIEDTGYSVSMAPVGEVEFTEPPENIYTARTHHADMALALGYGDGVNAMVSADLFAGIYDTLFEHLDGLSVDWDGLYDSYPTSKEKLYELDSDLHLEDPAYLTMNMDGWDPADIDEIRENISPWFGNSLSNEHVEPSEAYADVYQYYTLWEMFEKVSEVFQERDRYDALAEMHTNLVSEIESNLPPPRTTDRSSRECTFRLRGSTRECGRTA